MKIDRQKFFTALRASPLNGGRLTQMTVDCANAILDASEKYGIKSVEHLSVIFGQSHYECGNRLAPIKETVMSHHTDQNPSDDEVARRLQNAFNAGKLPWVKTPYWHADKDGKRWFGRSMPQITHKDNYAKLGKEIGVDLVGNPDLALVPKNAGLIAVAGMVKGLFTGVKLSDCKTKADFRRIVNGDHRDAALQRKLAVFYSQYEAVIRSAVVK